MLEPRKLAVQGKTIAGFIAPGSCSRLAEAVDRIGSDLLVSFSFYHDQQKRVRLDGRVETQVVRICQRCLSDLDIDLKMDISVVVVYSEEELRNLPHELDAWHLDEEMGDIIALVEDELLVSLPMVSCHPEGSCVIPEKYRVLPTGDNTQEKKDNPFNILKQLKASDTN